MGVDMSNVFKTEAEISQIVKKMYWTIHKQRGFEIGYMQSQDNLRPHIETLQDAYNAIHEKCALLEQAASEVVLRNKELEEQLQAAKDDAVAFDIWKCKYNWRYYDIKDGELLFINGFGTIKDRKQLLEAFQQSKIN
jgi:hypothetical protein